MSVESSIVARSLEMQNPYAQGSYLELRATSSCFLFSPLTPMLSVSSAPKFSTPEAQPLPSSGPSPPYVPQPAEQSHHDEYAVPPETYPHEREGSVGVHAPQETQQQQREPSPRRSMFDFVSPFDALTNTHSGKRKPAPQQPPAEDASWNTPVNIDPKRKSVENLMDQLTRGQAPLPQPTQPSAAPYDPYQQPEEIQQAEPAQARGIRPLPPHPTGSPRSSPPKQASQPTRQQRRAAESPIGGSQGPFGNNYHRDKEGSPLPQRGSYENRRNGPKGKNTSPR